MARLQVPSAEAERQRRVREIKRRRRSAGEQGSGSDDTPFTNFEEVNINPFFLRGDDACTICDNGGSLTCCDGGCKRSFHVVDDQIESKCRLFLRLSEQQAKMINDMEEKFICKNCKYKQHQCFACGSLGSSDTSSGAEVFQCEQDDCGHFYHPNCVAMLLYPNSELQATLFKDQVSAGVKFSCPVHECNVCKGGENKADESMQFAVCRRCPTTYHRKCLPGGILFDASEGPRGAMQRAWEGILRNRILIYCMKHEIDRKLKTPKRRIVFPSVPKVTVECAVPVEQDAPAEEELPDQPSPEQPQPPAEAAGDQDQCCCSSPLDSFAPASLFMHPPPGSCGWLDD